MKLNFTDSTSLYYFSKTTPLRLSTRNNFYLNNIKGILDKAKIKYTERKLADHHNTLEVTVYLSDAILFSFDRIIFRKTPEDSCVYITLRKPDGRRLTNDQLAVDADSFWGAEFFVSNGKALR